MKCMKCGGETIKHDINDAKEGEVCEPRMMIGDIKIECISLGHESDEIWFICPKCETYHLQCPKCLCYCRLIGFPGEMKSKDPILDGQQFILVAKPQDNAYIYEIYEGDLEEVYPENCVMIPEIMKVYFLDTKKWYPTGDGSRFSKWKCEKCDYAIDSFD